MNCDYCGAPLTLEDEKCPHCGHINEHAQIHARDMAHYKNEFEETQSEVNETMGQYKGLTARLIVLFAVVVFTIAMFVIWTGEYNIYRNHVIRQTKANSRTICERADKYLEDRDYVSFLAYADEHEILSYKLQEDSVFSKYYPLANAIHNYNYIYDGVMQIVIGSSEMDDYYAEHIPEYVDDLYAQLNADEDSFVWEYGDSEFTKETFDGISESLDGLFMAYLGFTPEDIENMHTATGARRDLLIEDKVAETLARKADQADMEGSDMDGLRSEMTADYDDQE